MDEASFDSLLGQWNTATANLAWGVQRAFRSVFEAVRDDGTSLMYGADYSGGFPCLINTVGVMLTTGGGHGVPSAHFGEVVSLFDRINRELEFRGVNIDPNKVSPIAAEIFLTHFAPLKPEPEPVAQVRGIHPPARPDAQALFTDAELEQALTDMFLTEPDPNHGITESEWVREHARQTSE